MESAAPVAAAPVAPAPAPSAPIAETPTPTISAERDAANKGDFAAFARAESASRDGKPLERVQETPKPVAEQTPPVEVAKPTEAERTISKRQQQINDYERRIAEQNERIARLEQQTRPAAEPQAPPEKVDPAKRYAAMADAPKLASYDSVEEHAAAMALFVHSKLAEENRQQQEFNAHRERFDKQSTTYGEKLRKSAEADPAFLDSIAPELMNAVPASAYARDEKGNPYDAATGKPVRLTFANAVTDVGFNYSEDPGRLYRHLTANASETNAIAALPPDRIIPALIALDARLAGMSAQTPAAVSAAPAAPPADLPSTVSAAPPPPPSISKTGSATDPQAAAFARGDFAAWNRIETEKMRKSAGAA